MKEEYCEVLLVIDSTKGGLRKIRAIFGVGDLWPLLAYLSQKSVPGTYDDLDDR